MAEELKSQQHSGSKYHKQIRELAQYGNRTVTIDVYSVIEAFQVTSNPVAHAVKKLLMSGKRGGKSTLTDYREAIDAIYRAIEEEINHPVAEPKGSIPTIPDSPDKRNCVPTANTNSAMSQPIFNDFGEPIQIPPKPVVEDTCPCPVCVLRRAIITARLNTQKNQQSEVPNEHC